MKVDTIAERNHRFNQRTPYYLRASFLMDGEEWLYLNHLFRNLKDEFEIPQRIEIKYSDIWTLQKYQINAERALDKRLRLF